MNDESKNTGDPELPGSGSANVSSAVNAPEDQDAIAYEQPSDSTASVTGDPELPGSGDSGSS
jgi:hypothetical protein